MGAIVKVGDTSWFGILTATLAVVFAWQVWNRIRQRVLYDLHKIPGPQPLPLIGNLHQILGDDTYHRVRTVVNNVRGPDWSQGLAFLLALHAGRRSCSQTVRQLCRNYCVGRSNMEACSSSEWAPYTMGPFW